MRFILIVLSLNLMISMTSLSQNTTDSKYKISGKIMDEESGSPLTYATVSVHEKQTQKLILGSITSENGTFRFELTPGNYYLEANFISYQTKRIDVTVIDSNIKVPPITLVVDSQKLNEVVINAEKEQVQFSLDKRTFNVEENISNQGKNAADILDNLPSVQVDIEGNVSLRGNESVTIFVDGKPSGLVGISNADALRQLQGSMIESIEVVTNPSARYDAEGTTGIINIILKKEAKKGLNGAFDVGVGFPANYNAATSLNYRSGRLNFFINTGINYRQNNGFGNSTQTFDSFITERDRKHIRGGLSQNLRAGADYFFSETSILTGAVIFKNSDENNNTTINYQDNDLNGMTINQEKRRDEEMEDENYLEFSLNYKKTFRKEDHELILYTQYRDNSEIEKSDIMHEYFTAGTDTLQQVLNDEGEKNLLIQADYIHPLTKENTKFEAGLRANIRQIGNDYLVEQFDKEENTWSMLTDFSNDFEYSENIYAAYLIYASQFSKISYQLGIRTEITDITTNQITTGEINHKDYPNFFPSAHITYKIRKDRDLQVSYSRRIRRPRFRLLNPFSSFSDNRNIRTGNPNLDPEITDILETGYLMNWENASVYGGVYYNYSTDVIQRISQYSIINSTDSLVVSQPFNITSRDSYGIELTLSKELNDWFRVNGNFNFFRSIIEGSAEFGDEIIDLNADVRSWNAQLNSTITLPGKIDVQANFNYRGPRNTTQGRRLAFYTLDIGLSKDLWEGKGTITASVQDLFNTRIRRSETITDSYTEESEFQWRSRQLMMSFTYRLNQKSKKKHSQGGGKNSNNGGDDF